MADNNKRYWKGLEDLNNDPQFLQHAMNEFPGNSSVEGKGSADELTGGTHRRDFLKMLGFGVAAASLAACEAPVRKAIPYVIKPEDIDPGVANWYASTFFDDGGDYSSILVKTREGRPIKIEGNKFSSVTKGGLSVRGQAAVLSLYDQERLNGPRANGQPSSWSEIDSKVKSELAAIAGRGGQIRIVSSTIISPSTKAAIAEFTAKYPTAKQVTYDAISAHGILKANEINFGKAVIPSYDFSKANVIVSFGADFLSSWISSNEFARQYAEGRRVNRKKKTMSRHYQFEANMTLSGANADFRTPLAPSKEGLALAALYKKLGGNISAPAIEVNNLDAAAKDLLKEKGSSLVVSGSNDPAVQQLVNAINQLLGNYDSTINLNAPVYLKQGNDEKVEEFVNEVKQGVVDAVFFYGVNPVYSHAKGAELKEGLKKVALSVSFAQTLDETAAEVKYIAPDHHFLESWNDAEPKAGQYSLGQPTISPIFKTRQAQESLLKWAGNNKDYYSYIQDTWKNSLYSKQTKYTSFQEFWDRSLHNGVFELPSATASAATLNFDGGSVGSAIAARYKANNTGLELVIFETEAIGTGSSANNPWLQEFPNAITKACWDNYITISKADAQAKGLKDVFMGNTFFFNLKVKGKSVKVPALIQPGQAKGTIGLAFGYGRTKAGKVANNLGVNAAQFVEFANGFYNSDITSDVTIEITAEKYQVAHTQTHQTIMGRDIIQEANIATYKEDPTLIRNKYKKTIKTPDKGEVEASSESLWFAANWQKDKYNNHFWGMVIDLNSCIGCGSCVIGCQSENNIPVVGRDEVINSREMHWLRIDRYYSTDLDDVEDKTLQNLRDIEEPSENPKVLFQPMLCQHCNNAPCETVCPVLATTHSTEGLNQMTYNRCVGTRYCANNCPYKVRRFNWFHYYENEKFDYNMNNALGKMVLNPDVTVRARGVMEKCSMCVQRIQEGKLNAKKENRRPVDGEIEMACSQSCSTGAIVFGDMNDPESKISKLIKEEMDGRLYHVLDEINTRPSISYLTKIRNDKA